nr:hypothetical protein [Tanacetum cinerariifolium]
MVQQLGEASAIPTDPRHTPTIIPSSTQPQKKQQPRKPKRKDIQVHQPSGHIESVVDKVVHKELGDRLMRAATTASSLEAEQDSGNITKTQSKATPNEPSSQGTNSGSGSRCQETIGDTIAQSRVLDLEHTNTTQKKEIASQQDEIASLKRMVKKLEKRNRSRTHGLKILYKVGLTTRIESFSDEESLSKDASKQGRMINVIDADEDITLVSAADNEMFNVDILGGEEVFVAGQNKNIVKEVVDAAQVKGIFFQEPGKSTTTKISSEKSQDKEERLAREKAEEEKRVNIALIEEWDDIQAKIDADHQLAERLKAQEQEELYDAEKATLFQQLLKKRRKHFAAKRAEEKRNKPQTKSQQRKIMCTYLKNMEGYELKDLKLKEFNSIKEMFDRAFKRVNTFEDFRTKLVEGKKKEQEKSWSKRLLRSKRWKMTKKRMS